MVTFNYGGLSDHINYWERRENHTTKMHTCISIKTGDFHL